MALVSCIHSTSFIAGGTQYHYWMTIGFARSFLAATCHAVSAARAANDIPQHDPDLSFMAYFFGIQLLQGGPILLLIADKLQDETNECDSGV